MPFLLPPDISAPRQVVVQFDEAFDNPDRTDFPADDAGEAAYKVKHDLWVSAWKHYEDTGDWSRLPLKSGILPTVFLVESPKPEHTAAFQKFVAVQGGAGLQVHVGAAALEKARYCVVDIQNLRWMNPETGAIEGKKVQRVAGEYGKKLPDDIMQLFRDPMLLYAIGHAVDKAAHISQEQDKSH